jgi:poly(A) polymerase
MRRMLELPRVGTTLATMVGAGVLPLSPELLDRLASYERHTHKPSFAGRMGLLLAAPEGAGLKDRWRLSNDEMVAAERVLLAARLLVEFHINEAAYRFPAVLSDAIDVAAALAGWTEAGKAAIVQQLEAIEVPLFPLSGNDLLKAGMSSGPKLGSELERLEKNWIASNFRLERDELLADLRR